MIHENSKRICELWEKRVRANLPSAKDEQRPILIDHLPDVIENLVHALSPGGLRAVSETSELGKAHGAARALTGNYDLAEVLSEYRLLRQILMDVLEENACSDLASNRLIHDTLDEGIANSASEFLRVQAEQEQQAVQNQEAWLTALLDRLPIPLLLVRPTAEPSSILFANSFARNGPIPFPLELPDSAEYFATDPNGARIPLFEMPRNRAARGESFTAFEMTWHTPVGVFPMLVNGTYIPELYGHSPVAVLTVQDIRDRKDIESRWRETIQQLEQEKQIREQFVTALSHDLRGPLTAALGSAELLGRLPENAEAAVRLNHLIIGNLRRIDQMIRDLLDANRLKAGQRIPLEISHCDLRALVRDVCEEMRVLYGDRFELRTSEPVEGFWSPTAVRRILENLVSNAIKYGRPESPITVTVVQHEHEAALCVHNLGNPIPPDEIKTLFKMFHRTSRAETSGKRGWGIGLTLVQGLAQSMGGIVSVESSEAQGTIFTVTLPEDSRPFQIPPS